MRFKDILKLYGIEDRDIEEIKTLYPYFTEEVKKKIAQKTFDFLKEYLPSSYEIIKRMGVSNAFNDTIESFLITLLEGDLKKISSSIDTIVKTHILIGGISPGDFAKDYCEFIRSVLEETKIPPDKETAFRKLLFLLVVILAHIVNELEKKKNSPVELDLITKLPSKSKIIYNTEKLLNKSSTIILIDIENFSEYNLHYGYNVGNSVLAFFASVLQEFFPNSYVTRLQNDDFLVATLKTVSESKETLYKLQTYLQENPSKFPTPFGPQEIKIEFTAVLLEVKKVRNLNFQKLNFVLHKSLKDLYDTFLEKIHLITEEETLKLIEDYETIIKLLKALNNGKVKIAKQRIVNVHTGQQFFCEILARVEFPNGKIVTPGAFIELIENSSLERKLDKAVIEKTFECLSEKVIKGPVSLNLSFPFLKDDFFWLLEKINYFKINPELIFIELTERGDVLTVKGIREKIKEIRNLGMKVIIDDYGIKFSNYNLMKSLKIDGIKIDGSIIKTVKDNPLDKLFVESTIKMARLQNIFIIAEYVETKDEVEKLKKLAEENNFYLMFYGQGYYWSKPELIQR